MSYFPWVRFTGTAVGLMGMGYLLMKATVPTEEELYNKMSPDIRKKVDAARALRLAREEEMKQQVVSQLPPDDIDPDSLKPIWADSSKK